jgi:2-keto-4-pentenoate hydratase
VSGAHAWGSADCAGVDGRTAAKFGDPLRAGEIVLSGALVPMVDVHPGDRVQMQISGLSAVSAAFGTDSG